MLKKLVSFFFYIYIELLHNGKMFVAWVLNEWPGLTGYPGIVEALQAFGADPSKQNAINLLAQLIMTLGAGHRLVKIAKAVLGRYIKE